MPKYLHELGDWPHLRWSEEKLAAKLASVRNHQGRLTGRMDALGLNLQAEAVLQSLTEEVTKSSEIEGESLDREQVRSSLARQLGMEVAGLKQAERNVEGVVQMMLDATQGYAAPLTDERLFGWHAALFPTGYSNMRKIVVGEWRNETAGPMQVVSGYVGHERVHFEAPAAGKLPTEMASFLEWFDQAPSTDPVIKAAIAHLWFVTIHPFEDGNGRFARAITDMALARSERSPRRFYSMSAKILDERKAYYDILERTQKGDLDITEWLEWFLDCLGHAFDGAEEILATVMRKARFWQMQTGQALNERQRRMLDRLLDGLVGKLTSTKWAKITDTSQDTASRDIDDLIKRRILFKEPGGGRSTSYMLVVTMADPLHAAAQYARQNAGSTVWAGDAPPTSDERARRRENINHLADEMVRLAEASLREPTTFRQFETLSGALREQGLSIDEQLVSAIAFAYHRDEARQPLLAAARA